MIYYNILLIVARRTLAIYAAPSRTPPRRPSRANLFPFRVQIKSIRRQHHNTRETYHAIGTIILLLLLLL